MTPTWIPCPECNGEGIVERETYHRDMISAKDVPCDNCGGSGEVAINDEDDLLEDDGFITVYESGKDKKCWIGKIKQFSLAGALWQSWQCLQ